MLNLYGCRATFMSSPCAYLLISPGGGGGGADEMASDLSSKVVLDFYFMVLMPCVMLCEAHGSTRRRRGAPEARPRWERASQASW